MILDLLNVSRGSREEMEKLEQKKLSGGPVEENTMVVFSEDCQKFIFPVEGLTNESEYFRALFESGMIESSRREVSLPCVTSRGLLMIQTFLNEEMSENMPLSNVTTADFEELIHAAVYLQMSNLLQTYEDHLMERLNVDNLFDIRTLAETFALDDVLSYANSYLMENISEIWKCENFSHEYGSIESLVALLESDELNFSGGEVEALFIIETFCEAKNLSTLDTTNLPRLLNCVRFPLHDRFNDNLTLLNNFIKDHKEKIPADVVSSLESIYQRVLSFQLNPNKRFTLGPEDHWGRWRRSKSVILGCGGFTKSESSTRKVQFLSTEHLISSCQNQTELQFDLPSKNLDKTLRLPTPLVEHAVCVLNGYLYVAGGQHKYCSDGRHTSNKCYRFDPLYNAWIEIGPMISTRSLFYLGALNGCLYAVCGWTGPNSVTKSVECYDVLNDVWKEVARVPIGLHEHAGCSHQGQLYVSGGYRGPYKGHLNQVWSYDPACDVWREKQPLTHRRSYHAMASIGEKLYVAGGVNYIGNDAFEDVLILEVYDPEVDQWSDLTQRLPRPACCMSSLVLDHQLLLFGGHSFENETDHNILQVFVTETSRFSDCSISSNRIQFFPVAQICVTFHNLEQSRSKDLPK